MTPQLQQAIKLLQMSNIELAGFVEAELESNPMLERPEGEEPEPGDATALEPENIAATEFDGESAESADLEGPPEPDSLSDFQDGQDLSAGDLSLDAEKSDLYGEDGPSEGAVDVVGDGMGFADLGGNASGGGFDNNEMAFDATLSEEISLKEHLREQVALLFDDQVSLLVATDMLEYLDDGGYFREDVAAVADRLGVAEDRVEAVLQQLQTLDPVGVFARNLAECLGAQLRERDRLDPAMATFIENLELLAKHDLPALMSICGVDEEDMRDMILEIRALNPKPGSAFDHDVAEAVVPDVYVREAPDGTWKVELNTETLPMPAILPLLRAK
jgi:RNA polymerase sigma-54 factor